MLLGGRRRYAVCAELGIKQVPVTVRVVAAGTETSKLPLEVQALALVVAENDNREDLSAWDRAVFYQGLLDRGIIAAVIAREVVHKTEGHVSQHLSILKLDPRVQALVRKVAQTDGSILGKVRVLRQVGDPEAQLEIAQDALGGDKPWTVADITEAVETYKAKLAERERKAEERTKAAKKARKDDGAAAADGGGAADDDEPEDVGAEFAEAKQVARLAQLRDLAALAKLRLQREQAKDAPDPAKVAYQKGALDTMKMILGLKKLPQGLPSDKAAAAEG
jgi:ParB/RepB/Spo0J family partition protein